MQAILPASKPSPDSLPNGVGGTITGGPMRPLDLMEILSARGLSGAMAAQTVSRPEGGRDVALSDGSRIIFTVLDQARVSTDA